MGYTYCTYIACTQPRRQVPGSLQALFGLDWHSPWTDLGLRDWQVTLTQHAAASLSSWYAAIQTVALSEIIKLKLECGVTYALVPFRFRHYDTITVWCGVSA